MGSNCHQDTVKVRSRRLADFHKARQLGHFDLTGWGGNGQRIHGFRVAPRDGEGSATPLVKHQTR